MLPGHHGLAVEYDRLDRHQFVFKMHLQSEAAVALCKVAAGLLFSIADILPALPDCTRGSNSSSGMAGPAVICLALILCISVEFGSHGQINLKSVDLFPSSCLPLTQYRLYVWRECVNGGAVVVVVRVSGTASGGGVSVSAHQCPRVRCCKVSEAWTVSGTRRRVAGLALHCDGKIEEQVAGGGEGREGCCVGGCRERSSDLSELHGERCEYCRKCNE